MARPNQRSWSPNLRLVQQTPIAIIEEEKAGSVRAFLKLEHLQRTGSFKLRGTTNKILCLSPEEAELGVVASSTGNHGLGVATAARHRGIDAEVFVSSQISPAKLRLIEESGARIRRVGDNPLQAEIAARADSVATGSSQRALHPWSRSRRCPLCRRFPGVCARCPAQ
jgi:threonine dehydratase